jgi:hypothetical protein
VYDVELGHCTILVDPVRDVDRAVGLERAFRVTQKALDGATARASSPGCSKSIEHSDRVPYIPCIEYDRVRSKTWSMHVLVDLVGDVGRVVGLVRASRVTQEHLDG